MKQQHTPASSRTHTRTNTQLGATIELNISNSNGGQQPPNPTTEDTIINTDTNTPKVDVQNNGSAQCQPLDDDVISREVAPVQKTMPRALRNLATYNKPGLQEQPLRPEGRR